MKFIKRLVCLIVGHDYGDVPSGIRLAINVKTLEINCICKRCGKPEQRKESQ